MPTVPSPSARLGFPLIHVGRVLFRRPPFYDGHPSASRPGRRLARGQRAFAERADEEGAFSPPSHLRSRHCHVPWA